MATVFAAFGKTLGNNKGSVQNFGIVGVTIASEELTKFIFFYCPCDYPHNKLYGSIFIWGPAVILFICGFLVNRRTWRLTTGLCNRTQGIGRGGKRIFHFLFIMTQISVKAFIAPATWVVLAFLKGDYYACAKWPNPSDLAARSYFHLKYSNDSLPRPCMFNSNPAKFDGSEAEVIARDLRAHSHTIGWLYLCMGLLIGVVSLLCFRCKSRYSYEQGNYIDRYRSNEVKLFEAELDKKAEEQAKRIVEGYFSKPRSKEEWDQIAVINDKVTRSKRGRAIYSPLHKFVNKELRAQEEADKIDDLVADAAIKIRGKFALRKKKPVPKNGGGKAPTGGGKASAGGGGDVSIPMTAMLLAGNKSKTKVITKAPIEKSSDAFQNVADNKSSAQTPPTNENSPPSVPPKDDVSLAAVVTPPTTDVNPSTTAQVTPNAGVTSPESRPEEAPASPMTRVIETNDPEVLKTLISQNYREEEPEILPAVKETSLGDFGGEYSENPETSVLESSDSEVDVGERKGDYTELVEPSQESAPDREEEEETYEDEQPLLSEE